ncbi:MAG TPA: hypothetical protein VGU23_02655, partial [Acidobacteriaceae bacterium]|nr:hypothetical protein [Acidobacteriaceae bacterium]
TDADARLHAGFTAHILLRGEKKKNVLSVPRQAVFLKDGKRFVYVDTGGGYEQRPIRIDGESESRSIVEGIAEGTRVALVDPTAPQSTGNGPSGEMPAGAGVP